jgi:DNA-binding HxlR family transcriptional regulator
MKPRHQNLTVECQSISDVLARVGDKWTVLVVNYLGAGPLRFNELQRKVDGISHKMLATTLRNLERDGFCTRTVFATVPPQVEYELTALGRDLLVPVKGLADWALANSSRIDEARRRSDGTRGPAGQQDDRDAGYNSQPIDGASPPPQHLRRSGQ